MRHLPLLAGAAALALTSPAMAAPPERTLQRFEEALAFFDGGDHGTTYTMRVKLVISGPDDSDRTEQLRVAEMVVSADGESSSTTFQQVIQDGVDVTDDWEAQDAFGQVSEEESAANVDGSFSQALIPPFGDDAAAYTVGDGAPEGGLMVADFGPAPGHEEDAGICTGRLAWHAHSGEPAWMECTLARNPQFVKSRTGVMEFTVEGDRIYPSRSYSDKVAEFLQFKRRAELEVTIAGVRDNP